MKKIAALLFGIALSPSIFAAAIAQNASAEDRSISSTDDCTLLAEDVIINLSRDVPAGYACNTGTNVIAFTACHPNGRKTTDGLNYIYGGSSAGGQISAVGANGAPSAACDKEGTAASTAATTLADITPVTPPPPETTPEE